MPLRTLVLCMGNPILSDDGVGLVVAERLRAVSLPDGVQVVESEVAGLRLLELMRGFDKVIIVDALKSGRTPGEIVRFSGEDFRGGHRYSSAHSIGIVTTLELGRKLEYVMPAEVIAFTVEAEDVETFGEHLSPSVAAAVDDVLDLVKRELGCS
ncbi:MAG: hydrogenase maturation protease [Actinobacteria bacterium]|nr:hydrogenase maturation protease [Actinomycetota bacterium]